MVEGDRLVLQEVWKGKKFDSCVFSPVSGNDNELVWAAYTQYGEIFRLRWQRAEGSEAALAEELRRWAANNIIDGMVGSLVSHVDRWAFERRPSPVSNVRRYPPRSALLPGGTFWKWKEAPHFENPITGGRMVLGPGAGNLDYWVNANRNEFKVIGHLYGGGETSQGEYSAP